MPTLKFHDLRKTFASLLAQWGVSTAVTQRLLEHSSPRFTNDVYTNVDPVLRQAIGQLPVAEWLISRQAPDWETLKHIRVYCRINVACAG